MQLLAQLSHGLSWPAESAGFLHEETLLLVLYRLLSFHERLGQGYLRREGRRDDGGGRERGRGRERERHTQSKPSWMKSTLVPRTCVLIHCHTTQLQHFLRTFTI